MPEMRQVVAGIRPEISPVDRERLWAKVKLAGEAVALNWPMRTFASRNPLMGYEHLPFDQARCRLGVSRLPAEQFGIDRFKTMHEV